MGFIEAQDLRSTYRHANQYFFDAIGIRTHMLPERVSFVERDDTEIYTCTGNERLYDIAILSWRGVFASVLDMWEFLAQFQPEPILDPSVLLPVGLEVHIPSPDFIQEIALGASLADVPAL